MKYWMVLCLSMWFTVSLSGQNVSPDTSKQKEILVDYADLFEYIQKGDTVLQKLNGNVELRQDSIYMYCDTAIIQNETQVFAQGDVIIQQGDSLSVFADSATYDGNLKLADLFGDVILVNGDQQLFTDRLTYDLTTKVATYDNNATLVMEETQLTSKKGYYYVREKQIYFKDSVVVIDPQFSLRSDTLGFNTETRLVSFLGPTLISNDSTNVYCEDGYYDTENNLALFSQNAQYVKGEQVAIADSITYDGAKEVYSLEGNASFEEGARKASANIIRYDEANDKTILIGNAKYEDAEQDISADKIIYDAKNERYATSGRSRISDPPQILEADQVDFSEDEGLGLARGNVVWRDTAAALTIVCEQADYDRQSDYLKASGGRNGRPLLISLLDEDSLYMTADTLFAIRDDSVASDSARQLRAFHDVRIYSADLQAICDSLQYSTTDSTFRLYREPIVWSDTSQFYADTVYMYLADSKIDQIFLKDNSFIINSPDEVFFNQVKGKNITAFFEEEELRRMEVNGNAESVYYAIDEAGGYVGVNKTVCSEMTLYFGNNEVEKIKFFNEPKANMLPMGQTNHNELKMPGFNWEKTHRPYTMDDLFADKPPRFPAAAAVADLPEGGDVYPEEQIEEGENATTTEEKQMQDEN
jgi:lipopolysaccharide export system protein LptA